jgi:hypothetical protein
LFHFASFKKISKNINLESRTMVTYGSDQYEDVKVKSLVFEKVDLPATVKQRQEVERSGQTALQRLIGAEKSRRVTTVVQRQEEEFLKAAMKSSDSKMDFKSTRNDSIRSKRSSIFNIPNENGTNDNSPSPGLGSADTFITLSDRPQRQSPVGKRELSVEKLDLMGVAANPASPLPHSYSKLQLHEKVQRDNGKANMHRNVAKTSSPALGCLQETKHLQSQSIKQSIDQSISQTIN